MLWSFRLSDIANQILFFLLGVSSISSFVSYNFNRIEVAFEVHTAPVREEKSLSVIIEKVTIIYELIFFSIGMLVRYQRNKKAMLC